MKNVFTRCAILLAVFFINYGLQAQLATWNFDGEVTAPSSSAMDVVADPAVFSRGLGTPSFPAGNSSTDSYSTNNWSTDAAFDDTKFLQISLSADECNLLEIRGFDFDERRSGTGVRRAGAYAVY
jgi:hypothetical protein